MFMSQPRNGGRTANRTELASLCGVSLPTVDTWVKRGCPFDERGSKGTEWKFDTAAVIGWRIEAAVADAAAAYGDDGAGMSKDEADRRRSVALAHMAEIDLEERLGRSVDRDDAVEIYAAFCVGLRNSVGSAFDKIASRGAAITNPPEIARMCRDEWNRAMRNARAEFHRLWDERFGTKGARPDDAPEPPLNGDAPTARFAE
ncbi:Terminase small subunit (DNA packaging protein Nu1) [Methylobacterium mesophilicum]